MPNTMIRLKGVLAVSVLLLIASCGGSGGGENSPPTPQPSSDPTITSGGTKDNPTRISVDSSVTSSISGISANYYLFTTGSSGGSYGIALTGAKADISWDLFAAADYSSYFVASCDKQFGAGNEICSATLEANKTYYLRVNCWDDTTSTFTLTVTFLDPGAGCGSGACINFESGSIPSSFVASGEAAWVIDNANAATGAYSIHSGAIADNQTSCFEHAPSGNMEVVLFSLKTDSEQWIDQLKFYIDGVMQTSSWSGNTFWMRVIFGVDAGSHTYKWCYTKDGSVSVGADRVWVDDIEFK